MRTHGSTENERKGCSSYSRPIDGAWHSPKMEKKTQSKRREFSLCIQTDCRGESEHNNNKTTMVCTGRTGFFVWTDNEVEMLLRLTLDYKASKFQESVDWESCQSKYTNITTSFRAQYPRELREDFPHDTMTISKTQVTTKLKCISGHAAVWALPGDLGWVARYSLHWYKHQDGWPGGVVVAALNINRDVFISHLTSRIPRLSPSRSCEAATGFAPGRLMISSLANVSCMLQCHLLWA